MQNKELERDFALAGVCQAAALVQMTARKGESPAPYFEASINSIVLTDTDSTEAVFGGIAQLGLGFKTIIAQLGNTSLDKDAEITRYVAGILSLERKISRKGEVLKELSERISQIQRQQTHMDLFERQMISNLASVYADVISPAGPKIQVAGTPAVLQQDSNQNKVRALLLAGVRAAVLWRQLGGKRRQILFSRKKIVKHAQQFQQQLN